MTPSDHSEALPSRRELRRRREQQAGDVPGENLTEADAEAEVAAPDSARSRRAADTPVDAPSTTASQEIVGSDDRPRRRSRRADADVTGTSSIPIVAAPRAPESSVEPTQEPAGPSSAEPAPADRPLTRRELRERRRGGSDRSEAAESADAPEAEAPAENGAGEGPVWDESGLTSTQSFKVAMGISDTGMLNSIDVEREAIAREAAALHEKIQQHGASNPQHIDPELLREQQALAERARELGERHRAEQFTEDDVAPAGDAPEPEPAPAPDGAVADDAPVAEPARSSSVESPSAHEPASAQNAQGTTEEDSAAVRRRRSDADQTRSAVAESASTAQQSPGNEPIGAQTAHGLDPLDTREWTSRERMYMTVSAIVFAVGIITLIIGLILMLR